MKQWSLGIVFCIGASGSQAAGVAGALEEMLVIAGTATGASLAGQAESASAGTVLQQQIAHRPILRPAEILETIPGMVVTQHSGGGKANQYFLRGFNLDHSTDFANYVEGAPVNMVTHGHGQGYSDLNFLIPELVDSLVYKKGPYYASEGDFSSVGSSRITYGRNRESTKIKLTGGNYGYRRALVVGQQTQQRNSYTYGFESLRNDGPWTRPDELKKTNGFFKYRRDTDSGNFALSLLYYKANWHGTDQIPQRLVADGTLDRFDTLDGSTGGDTHRYQLAWQQAMAFNPNSRLQFNAYAVDYKLDLFGNFTYFARDDDEDPDYRGDQIGQFDDRRIYGGALEWQRDFLSHHQFNLGGSLRYDDIGDVGVGQSQGGELYALNTRASVKELGAGVYSSVHSNWLPWFASILGVRYDQAWVDVEDKLGDAADGRASDNLWSPKASLRFGPFAATEFFLNYGRGFHSNDARGVVGDGGSPLISPSQGYEFGIRSGFVDNLQLSFVWFYLELDSELVFVGDDGTTEPKDSSERQGIELSLYYQPVPWLVLDADYTESEARFKDVQVDGDEVLGDYVPDSVGRVFSMGLSFDTQMGLYGGARLRYFGPRKLTESGDIESDSTSVINTNIGFQWRSGFSVELEVINLTDREDDDITYWYGSRTREERLQGLEPIEDFHSHPMVPRTVRASIGYEF